MSVQIRMATEADAEQMLAIYAPVVRETVISFEYDPPSLAEFRDRVRTTLERMPWLVCDNDGAIAGYACASPFRTRAGYRWACELTVGYKHGRWLDDGVWQIELQPTPCEPKPSVAWSEVAGLPQWNEALSAGLAYLKL